MIMVEIGGRFTKTYALDMKQNAICLAIGFSELPWGVILKQLPLKMFQCIDLKVEVPPDSDDEGDDDGVEKKKKPSGALALKKLSTQKMSSGPAK